jgi:cytochrome subunit of sulfide dehydrogenase
LSDSLIYTCLAHLPRQAILLALLPLHVHAADLTSMQQAHIQVLASSCAACHGTGGNSVGGTPVLAALDKTYFSKQMLAFRNGDRASTVMHHHAKGLTLEEIDQLATYFSNQPRRPALEPAPASP